MSKTKTKTKHNFRQQSDGHYGLEQTTRAGRLNNEG